jgi:hypothetical protein
MILEFNFEFAVHNRILMFHSLSSDFIVNNFNVKAAPNPSNAHTSISQIFVLHVELFLVTVVCYQRIGPVALVHFIIN